MTNKHDTSMGWNRWGRVETAVLFKSGRPVGFIPLDKKYEKYGYIRYN